MQAAGPGSGRLSSPNLEKALTFLDDKLLPATSNAVDEVTGAIARHKRASTQCGRLNTFASVSPWTCSGIAAPDRAQTTKALHQARSGTKKLQE